MVKKNLRILFCAPEAAPYAKTGDWQTGLAAAYHHYTWRLEPAFAESKTIFTIHNLAYQGVFPSRYFSLTGLPAEAFSLHGIEFWGNCNFLKAGLLYSDYLTTVSPRYSREIQSPENGHGLHGVLRERKDSLSGILNGIDQTVWDPKTDSFIAQNYGQSRLSGKRQCKEALFAEFGFSKESIEGGGDAVWQSQQLIWHQTISGFWLRASR